jgi:hypothetical protein
MKTGILLISVFALIIFSDNIFSQESWTTEFTREGITVSTRAVKDSSLKEFMGEGIVDAPVEVCIKVINDVENHVKWRPDCAESRLLKNEGNTAITYTLINAPWPASDRDVVVKIVTVKTEDSIICSFEAVNDVSLAPLKENVIRMNNMTGKWVLTKQSGKTNVVIQTKADPAGSLPAWLANSASTDQPFETISGLRKMVKDSKYAD